MVKLQDFQRHILSAQLVLDSSFKRLASRPITKTMQKPNVFCWFFVKSRSQFFSMIADLFKATLKFKSIKRILRIKLRSSYGFLHKRMLLNISIFDTGIANFVFVLNHTNPVTLRLTNQKKAASELVYVSLSTFSFRTNIHDSLPAKARDCYRQQNRPKEKEFRYLVILQRKKVLSAGFLVSSMRSDWITDFHR